ncbi:hypothetical protein ACIQAC_25540, partial [Streptomyces sp. NPDC088387]|uniref:hypothetical protein n=1 Tax=Streptomyces sp. NPDC088387 TaxID=3365859 RepID=UPI0038102E82
MPFVDVVSVVDGVEDVDVVDVGMGEGGVPRKFVENFWTSVIRPLMTLPFHDPKVSSPPLTRP